MVDSQIVCSGGRRHFVPKMALSESEQKLFKGYMGRISASDTPREPCSTVLFLTNPQVLKSFWNFNVHRVHHLRSPCTELVEKTSMHISTNVCRLFEVVECPPSTKITQSAKKQQFNWGDVPWRRSAMTSIGFKFYCLPPSKINIGTVIVFLHRFQQLDKFLVRQLQP
jgi:hypothetical protein